MITLKNVLTNSVLVRDKEKPYYRFCKLYKDVELEPMQDLILDTGIFATLNDNNEFLALKGESKKQQYDTITDCVHFRPDMTVDGKYTEEIKVRFQNLLNVKLTIPAGTVFLKLYSVDFKAFDTDTVKDKLLSLYCKKLNEDFYVMYDKCKYIAFQEPTLIEDKDFFLSGGFEKNEQ